MRSPEEFAALQKKVSPDVPGAVRRTVVSLAPALIEYQSVVEELGKWSGAAIDDMKAQLEFLLPRNAVTIHGSAQLRHLPRYLQAMRIRLEEMGQDPDKDADRQDEVEEAQTYLNLRLAKLPKGREKTREVKDIRWMIEELRVSLFAQRLGTARPISLRRIQKAVDKLR